MAEEQQNKWEEIFQYWLNLTEFTIIKHKTPQGKDYDPIEGIGEYGVWSVRDDQGANLGDIESQRFQFSEELVSRFADSIYFNDYILRELEDYFKSEEDDKFIEEQWNKNLGECDNWLNIAKNNPEFCEGRKWAFDIIEMFMHHMNDINLENCDYEEED